MGWARRFSHCYGFSSMESLGIIACGVLHHHIHGHTHISDN